MARQAVTGSQARNPGKPPEGEIIRPGAGKFRLKSGEIDAGLVDEISERVFALLLAELKIERERDRRAGLPASRNGG
jgi:hypothetical protein